MAETWPIGYRDTMRDGTIIEVAEELKEGGCIGCYFNNGELYCNAPFFLGECVPSVRDDHKGIIFKKVENHGETDRK